MNNQSIQALVRQQITNYTTGTTEISKHVSFSLNDNIEKIDAYLNSKHVSGDVDAQGRPKPFFNIVTSAVNIWHRATDIDRKNIRILANNSKTTIEAFLANIIVQEWMRKQHFGQFLNEWGRSLARYGSSVCKFIQKEGELHANIVPWNRLIIDNIDFDNNVVIEKLYFTPAQLMQNTAYDKDKVEELIENAQTTRKDFDNQSKDNKSEYIEIYEVHGMLPLSYLTDNEEDEEYVQQMHIISFVGGKDGKSQDFTLYRGREKKSPYMITHLIKEDGRATGIGAVEHLFQAQWMVNHSMQAIKNQLDLASKIIFQTSDPSLMGRNVLKNIENGTILIHSPNSPLTQANNSSHDITSLQNYASQWKALGQEITSTPDALMGKTAPAGTAWRQVEATQQEANSLFELMVENKGLYIEEMMTTYVLPHIKSKLNTSKEISAILEANDIEKLDKMYIKSEATRRANEKAGRAMLENANKELEDMQVIENLDIEGEAQRIQENLANMGNQRFIKPSDIEDKEWRETFKDLEWDVIVDVTGESRDNQATLTTLTTVLQTIAGNPAILQDKNAKMLFNKILGMTGAVSPLEIEVAPPAIA